VLEQAAAQELPQHPLDHRPQRAVAPGEALRPDPQQLLDVALDEPVERRVARTPRLVDPATDLHSRTRAGGEAQAEREAAYGGRASRRQKESGRGTGRARSGSRQPEGKGVKLARVCLESPADCGSPVTRPAPGSRLSLNCPSPRCKPGRGSPNGFCPEFGCDQDGVGPARRAWMTDPRFEYYLAISTLRRGPHRSPSRRAASPSDG
jgi:hypothetical protein